MGFEPHKQAVIVATLILIVIVIVALMGSVWPKQEDTFFELGLLGTNKTADSYFTDAHSTINLNAANNWFIYVYNHMVETENVCVRLKLLNSTMALPDDQKHIPSQVNLVAEFPLSIPFNKTLIFPISWSIMGAETKNGSALIKSLIINQQPVEVMVSDSVSSFKLAIELWVQDPVSGDFTFGWDSKEGFTSASLFMGFRFNSTVTS